MSRRSSFDAPTCSAQFCRPRPAFEFGFASLSRGPKRPYRPSRSASTGSVVSSGRLVYSPIRGCCPSRRRVSQLPQKRWRGLRPVLVAGVIHQS